ncbi:class I SAM-dependent methyltransferase [Tissierella sp.]|uniref:class I SAM-dependent methyltransferase n=1 Tax=Tissierella sp. TaxID=41274 RepID=UPI0028A83D59|nr:class I SAM-dependent methyltransferase [Tissierella sp.]
MKIKGIVEQITNESIAGWVIVNDDRKGIIEAPKVELKVNGETVAITFAVRKIEHESIISNHCGFKFLIKDLFDYLNKNDEITISVYDDILPIYKYGLSYKCDTTGNSSIDKLLERLNEGYVFDINGELKLSLKENEELRKEIIKLYDELRDIFNNDLSYDLYACYGTLLGIVREKNFISNDGNFDCAYLSKENNKDKVVEEFKIISKLLIKKGYQLKIFKSHIQVSNTKSDASINIYCSWFNDNLEFLLSFNYIGKEIISKKNKFEIETRTIQGSNVLIPKSYKDVLKQIYGERWEIPDFGFEWKTLNKSIGFLEDSDMNEIYWEQYYLDSKLQKPSSFCSFINDFIKEKYLILDIGCGSARDSFEFVQQGHEVIGLDRSEQAILFANSLIKEERYKNITFQKADISDKILMSEIFKKAKEQAKQKQKNIMYYSRFFLHSIDESNQRTFLEAISSHVDKGDIFVAEFRTKEDEERQKIYSNHYRRFIDEVDLLNQLKEVCDMNKLLLFQKGTGFAIYKEEDPFLARIIVAKS